MYKWDVKLRNRFVLVGRRSRLAVVDAARERARCRFAGRKKEKKKK